MSNTLSAIFPDTRARAAWTADRLHVEATHAEQRAVEQLLNDILDPLSMAPPPRSAAEDALAATYGEGIALGSLSVGSWIEELEARTNLPVVIVGGTQEDLAARVELDFEGVPTLRQIADSVAQVLGRVLDVGDHAVLLSPSAPRRLRVYRVPPERWRGDGIVLHQSADGDSHVEKDFTFNFRVPGGACLRSVLPGSHPGCRFERRDPRGVASELHLGSLVGNGTGPVPYCSRGTSTPPSGDSFIRCYDSAHLPARSIRDTPAHRI